MLGPDEEYPEWLWELADWYQKPIDEKLKEPNWLLFHRIERVRRMMHHSVQKMRHRNPNLYEKIKFPTDEEVIDR